MKKLMFRNCFLFILLLIIIIVGNVLSENKTSPGISRTMKDVIWNITKEKSNVPSGFGSALDLVEAMVNAPGIYQDVSRGIQVVIYGQEYDWWGNFPPDMPSGRELYSIYRLMVDNGMIDRYEQMDVKDVMQYTPKSKWEFRQLPQDVRKKINAIYQIANSSDPKKLVSALLKNSYLFIGSNNHYDPGQLKSDLPFRHKITAKNEYKEMSELIMKSFPEAGEDLQSWARTFGGILSDSAYSIQQTDDGGYIVAGYASSHVGPTGNDFWVLKLDAAGDIEWQRVYAGSCADMALSIQQTDDGGYIVAGYASSHVGPTGNDFWVLKLDAAGDIEWQRVYGGNDSDWAKSIQQTDDGGYIVAGTTYSFGAGHHDFWVLKLDAAGDIEWQRAYGGSDYDIASSIQQTDDGRYIVAGYTRSFGAGERDFWVLKLDAVGDIEWQRAYGGSDYDGAESIQQTDDGGYIVAGTTWSFSDGLGDFWILKLSSDGDIEWQRTYGGIDYDIASSIQQTDDGRYIVAGYTRSFGAEQDDFWVLKLSSYGDIEWQHTYGGVDYDIASSIQQTDDGGYIVAGRTNSFGAGHSDFLILKLDSAGVIKKLPEIIGNSNAEALDTYITPQNTYTIPQDTSITPQDTNIIPQETDVTGILLFSPPLNFSGKKVLNRSLCQAEYLNVLTWEANPSNNDLNIVKYRIYRIYGEKYLLAELNADTFEYWHRKVWKEKQYIYAIVGVNNEGQESILAYTTIQ